RSRLQRVLLVMATTMVTASGLLVSQAATVPARAAEDGSTVIGWTADGEQERLTAPEGDPFIDVAVADGPSQSGEAAVLGLTKSGKVLAAGKGRFGEEKLPDTLGSKTITYLSTNEGTGSAGASNRSAERRGR